MRDAALIFWLMDVMNLPFMEMFDTTYPLNEEFWVYAILILLFIREL
jgi:hypothetical protein